MFTHFSRNNFRLKLKSSLYITGLMIFIAAPNALAVPAEGHKIMISGPSPTAIGIGKDIARKGGNAVDAAVAVALSLAVTHPYYASFGGGGFALVSMSNTIEVTTKSPKVFALDFREKAPSKSDSTTFKDKAATASVDGGLAAGIPGIPAGLWELHKKFGKLPWATLFNGAIHAAETGFEVSGEWAKGTGDTSVRFNTAGKKYFLDKNQEAYKPGSVMKQPTLAKFLHMFAKQGPRAFYTGPVAKDLIDTANEAGGIWSREDLSAYKPRWLEPLSSTFSGHTVYLMPPPSSGGVVIMQALRLIEKIHLTEKAPLSVDELHGLAEIMKLSYQGRSLLGDPDFVKNPTALLANEERLTKLVQSYKWTQSMIPAELPADILTKGTTEVLPEKEQTTHISVMTANGDSVAMTLTLNGFYGSAVVSKKYGIALNNEMDDFTTHPNEPNQYGLIQGSANQVRPGARPLSSMSPTLVQKDGRNVITIGAPGGPKIISSVLQVTYRLLTQDYDVDQAIQAPRIHHQYKPDVVTIDKQRLSPEIIDLLQMRGHSINFGTTGKVYAIRRSEKDLLSGGFDSRGEGATGGF
jgi:gamma-glutamyltranspeptidase/glutathione hydrolase